MIDHSKKVFVLSFKKLVFLLLITAIVTGGSIIFFVEFKNYINYSLSEISPKSYIPFLKDFEEKGDKNEGLSVKVVFEESQTIEVVKKASPAVVSIVATVDVPSFELYYDSPFTDLPEELQNFFDFQILKRRQNGTEKTRIGAGSGFLVSSDGYIVTNKHVVTKEIAEYTVFLNDEIHRDEKIIAKVIALHPNNDLAILKIDLENLPFLSFGDSDSLQVGQTAITIGYALGEFENTVSRGVISGLSRSIVAEGGFGFKTESLKDLIQSDAAINPGNSGGPMLDIEGNVIGVNVAMASGENIGFAIPGNVSRKAFEEVRSTGKIKGE